MLQQLDEMETNERKILDFPDELLLLIFSHLSDQSLLDVTSVCKRFKTVAGGSFAEKYSGLSEKKYFSVEVSGESFVLEQKQYQLLFTKFGDKMKAIKINFLDKVVARDHWLIVFIQRYCKSITKAKIVKGTNVDLASIIRFMPNLTHLHLQNVEFLYQDWTNYTYGKLISFSAKDVKGSHDAFAVFVDRNPQLENLSLFNFIERPNNALYTVNGKLNKLKTLELVGNKTSFTNKSTILRTNSLKSLTVKVNKSSFVTLLSSIRNGFKSIEELVIYHWDYYKLDVREIELICPFQMLKTLKLTDAFELPYDLLKTLIINLPYLISLNLGNAENLCQTHDDLLNVVYVCRKLKVLRLDLKSDLPILNYNFYTRFTHIVEVNQSNLKLELWNENEMMIITSDEAHLIEETFYEEDTQCRHILYWKGYEAASSSSNQNLLELNEEILKKIFTCLDGNALLAFYETCMQAKQLVIEHITKNVFHCTVAPRKCTNENVFMRLGEYIQRIKVNLEYDTYDDEDDEDDENSASHKLKIKFMKCVNQYCGKSLIEMAIDGSVQIDTVLYWPKLKKLKIFSYIDAEKLQRFQCPELTHLVVENITDNSVSIDWANCFPNLTSLEFDCYNDCVEAFLCGMNAKLCCQMENLSLRGSWNDEGRSRCRWTKLVNIITRFRRLVTLDIYMNGIYESNHKFLFENCSKLVELTFFYNDDWIAQSKYLKMLRSIQVNCKDIQLIQFVFKAGTFFESTLQKIYAMFPRTKFNLIDSRSRFRNGKCMCKLSKK